MPIAGWLALVAGGAILSVALGIRQTFGLFLSPMSIDLGLNREAFALALAIQNLLWGFAQPIAGMIADRFGAARVLVAGTLAYAGGLVAMAMAGSVVGYTLGAGLLVGLALSCTSFPIVLGAVGRLVSAERRSMALGIVSAGGSFGQFVMAPVGQRMIQAQGWSGALMSMAIIALAMAPLALLIGGGAGKGRAGAALADGERALGEALADVGRSRSYWYLTFGFFVCGFQVVFIGVHLPAYLLDIGLSASVGATALALIGFFNIIGTWGCGALGGRYPKKYLLSMIYVARSVVIVLFLLAPKNDLVVLVFASTMGLLWLGTVPLTSGLVGTLFGVRYLSTLFGLVFLSHQVGSFLGVWLGGWIFDRTGSYDLVWYASIVLGVIAAAVHLPIREAPYQRPAVA